MALTMNQFSMQAVKGQLNLGVNANVINARIKSDSVATFGSGSAVKIVDIASNGEIIVEKAAATDEIYGFITYKIKDNSPVAGDRVEVAFANSFMIMEAGAAIAAGASLEIVASGDKVITNAGSNKVVGIALKKAAADGDLIIVHILTPLVNQIIASADLPAIAFTDLSDTPADYSGAASDTVKVNATPDGLEFVTV